MRLIATAAALLMTSAISFAAEAEGEIKKVDKEALTITLENGKDYKLPPEVDLAGIEAGMTVVIAFDTVDGQNLITDMQPLE